ncbi:Biopolymer transport protein ExbD [Enhygromyxa salina]|uniref:Biopolymer transport protein ExbD n=1 Tax=Enhygromyxa salina TaxID=215803 RepID=A0A2S9XRH6_9BACT|nr:biopolymer transporter ExbD [Enhygromyxa salina]PRP95456.1 Biopolymer transport protein ExbD [Enhygromyxa salina]
MDDEIQTEAVAEINVTPMIDVLLSLLIIFMVAAKPPPKHKQPISIPQDPIEQTENDPDATLLVKIDADGAVQIGKTPVAGDHAALVAALEASEKAQSDGRVAVKADDKVPYGSVIDVMSAAREAGIDHVGIASEKL